MEHANARQAVIAIIDDETGMGCQWCHRAMRLEELAKSGGATAVTAMVAVTVERFHQGELYFNDADRQGGGKTFALLKTVWHYCGSMEPSEVVDFLDLFFHEEVIRGGWFDYRSMLSRVLSQNGDTALIPLVAELERAKEPFITALAGESIFLVNRYYSLNQRLVDSWIKKPGRS